MGAPRSGPPPHVDLPRRRRRRRRRPRRCPPCARLGCGRCWRSGCAARPPRVVSIGLSGWGCCPRAAVRALLPPPRPATWGDPSVPSLREGRARPWAPSEATWFPKVWTAWGPLPGRVPSPALPAARLPRRVAPRTPPRRGSEAQKLPFSSTEFGVLGSLALLVPRFLGLKGNRGRAAGDTPSPAADRRGAERRNARFWPGGAGAGPPSPTACTFQPDRVCQRRGTQSGWVGLVWMGPGFCGAPGS